MANGRLPREPDEPILDDEALRQYRRRCESYAPFSRARRHLSQEAERYRTAFETLTEGLRTVTRLGGRSRSFVGQSRTNANSCRGRPSFGRSTSSPALSRVSVTISSSRSAPVRAAVTPPTGIRRSPLVTSSNSESLHRDRLDDVRVRSEIVLVRTRCRRCLLISARCHSPRVARREESFASPVEPMIHELCHPDGTSVSHRCHAI